MSSGNKALVRTFSSQIEIVSLSYIDIKIGYMEDFVLSLGTQKVN